MAGAYLLKFADDTGATNGIIFLVASTPRHISDCQCLTSKTGWFSSSSRWKIAFGQTSSIGDFLTRDAIDDFRETLHLSKRITWMMFLLATVLLAAFIWATLTLRIVNNRVYGNNRYRPIAPSMLRLHIPRVFSTGLYAVIFDDTRITTILCHGLGLIK